MTKTQKKKVFSLVFNMLVFCSSFSPSMYVSIALLCDQRSRCSNNAFELYTEVPRCPETDFFCDFLKSFFAFSIPTLLNHHAAIRPVCPVGRSKNTAQRSFSTAVPTNDLLSTKTSISGEGFTSWSIMLNLLIHSSKAYLISIPFETTSLKIY